jgi:hypothetical protein
MPRLHPLRSLWAVELCVLRPQSSEPAGTIAAVKAVVLGPRPTEPEELIRRRRKLGIDTFDEVWEGSYQVAPAAHRGHGHVDNELAALLAPMARSFGLVSSGPFNLGHPDDYRVPDRGYHRGLPTEVGADGRPGGRGRVARRRELRETSASRPPTALTN